MANMDIRLFVLALATFVTGTAENIIVGILPGIAPVCECLSQCRRAADINLLDYLRSHSTTGIRSNNALRTESHPRLRLGRFHRKQYHREH